MMLPVDVSSVPVLILAIPILPKADGGTVWVLEEGTPREVKIVAGATDGKVTEILSGEIDVDDLFITEQINE